MKNFGRVLKIASRRRWSLLGILITSLIIAVLWGTNIGAIYPLVEVVFEGQSFPEYTEKTITETDQRVADLDSRIAALQDQVADATDDEKSRLQVELETAQVKRTAATDGIYYLRKLQPTIDKYAPDSAYATLLVVMGFLVVGTALKLTALAINLLLVQFVAEKTSIEIRRQFFRKALHLDLDSFGENGSSDLTARLTNDISHVTAGLGVLLGRLIREPLKMAVCFGGAMMVCPRLLLMVMVVTPIIGIVMNYLSKAIRRASRKLMEEMSQLYGMLNDSFAGIRVVKAFTTQGFERAKFNAATESLYRKSMKMSFYNTLARSSSELLGICTVSLAILAGGYLVVNQKTHLLGIRMSTDPLTVGQILTFFALLIGASDPAKKLSDVWSGLQRGIAATDRVFAVIDKQVRVQEPAVAREVARPHSRITFSDVAFQYPSGPTVLRGIDLTIRHGETIAVVGPNGSGKSTLVNLLCRFDDPQSGSVSMDGVPLREMRTRDLRKRIALVTQRTVLFDDTIENNIRYGSPGADAHAVVRAAKMAFADDFIHRKTPDGYQTKLGCGGMRLSGGQMQRIALARAFLRDPDLLILDEATSQIDLESEQLIHQALAKFLVDRTGVMITHRPTSLAMADRIVVIEAGRVADSGHHAHLLERNRFYQSLCGADFQKAA
ncbi:Putative multidrug export ATP-binding/permease protein [Rubripirellula lacrimiformis]|uniref:Multidrug export ATP-binding/permease protein n=1 Tax=Rubripirellula lacrimiformis TaxID=1930273 RepID=A0A517NFQ3_9BACT|nr:ABC transporter ATP-binding protein [Rubripirellula lacrimiformis]QDT05955.1 Putative multidrug export ATP-binding/permease protein [Rubripirellula lacrimiformis]